MGRLGIDLSGDAVILAVVSPEAGRLHLRDYERLEANPDLVVLADDLRRVRRQHRFPRRAEVVAWAGDPRVNAVRDAGYNVERTIMPGEALGRVARLRYALMGVARVTAVLSVDTSGGALAIVRDATVLQETALTWSARAAADASETDLLRRYSFLSELTETLGGAFSAVLRSQNVRVEEILTCGSLPDLRSLTMPLADEFDVEVETLDSVGDLDVRVQGRMPEEIADAIPTLWIAMVASRRWHPSRRRPVRKLLKVAVPAGLAAGFALMMWAGDPNRSTGSTGSTGSRGSRASTPSKVPSVPAKPVAPVPAAPPRAEATRVPSPAAPAPSTRSGRPEPIEERRAETLPLQPVRVEPPRAQAVGPATEPARPATRPIRPALELVRPAPEAARPTAETVRPAPQTAGPSRPTARVQTPPSTRSLPPVIVRRRPAEPSPVSLPLTSILWSAERQLVVADGQTLGVGDTIAGMRIVAIEQDSVIVRDSAGRLRRATLRRGGPETP